MRDPGGGSAVSRSLCHRSRLDDDWFALREVNQSRETHFAEADLHAAPIVVGDSL